MKTKKIILTFIAMTAMVSFSIASETIQSGKSYTSWGDYKVVKEDSQSTFNKKNLETYTIHYANVQSPVIVGVDYKKRCNNYIVKINGFEMQYSCTKKSFGAVQVSPQYATSNEQVVSALLDNNSFSSQQNIGTGGKDTEYILNIIACYFPQLIKSDIASK